MHVSGHSGIGYEFFPPFSNPIGIPIGIFFPIGIFSPFSIPIGIPIGIFNAYRKFQFL